MAIQRLSQVMAAFALVAAARACDLKEIYNRSFLVGAALNQQQFLEADKRAVAIVTRQYNTIRCTGAHRCATYAPGETASQQPDTLFQHRLCEDSLSCSPAPLSPPTRGFRLRPRSPENALKWESVHPSPDAYDFADADAYVDFGTSRGMMVHGHNILWHWQTPDWVFEDHGGRPAGRQQLLLRLQAHVNAVVGRCWAAGRLLSRSHPERRLDSGVPPSSDCKRDFLARLWLLPAVCDNRYRGRIGSWDVANEVIDEDGSYRQTKWYLGIGEDYIEASWGVHDCDAHTAHCLGLGTSRRRPLRVAAPRRKGHNPLLR